MASQNSYQTVFETKQDFKISWQLFKENWKAFISTILFATFMLIVIIAVMFIIVHFIPSFFAPNPIENFTNVFNRLTFFLTRFSIVLIAVLVFFAFLSCQYGLAYDIMSSGDMFAEFKGSFTYFRRHWWQYSLLTLFISWGLFPIAIRRPFSFLRGYFFNPIDFLFNKTKIPAGIGSTIIRFIFYFIWFLLFINTLTSITAQGDDKIKTNFSQFKSFKYSFIESFRIFRKYPKRLFLTWGLFFLIFYIPLEIISYITKILSNLIFPPAWLQILQIILPLIWIFFILIGTSMMSLIATRIFNSVEFEHCRTVEQSKRKIQNIKTS